jgi:hypothetical protein
VLAALAEEVATAAGVVLPAADGLAGGGALLLLPPDEQAVTPSPTVMTTAAIADLSGLVLIVYNLSMSREWRWIT